MAVHTQDERVRVLQMVFQARYSDGYRFLDRAGEVLNHIRHELPLWSIVRIAPQEASLRYSESQLVANFGVVAVAVSRNEEQKLAEAEKYTEEFGRQSELLYNVVVEKLGLTSTLRVGVRYLFFAPADSLEEADRLVCKVLQSPYQEEVRKAVGMNFVDGMCNLSFEDQETGLRRSVQTYSVITKQPPGTPEFHGFPIPGVSGGIMVDVDSFTRPVTGHFVKLSLFIQDTFLMSRRIASNLMRWIVQPKK